MDLESNKVSFFVDKKSAGVRLDRFLQEKLPWRSRTGIQKLIEEGRVLRKLPGQGKEDVASRVAARLVSGETLLFLVPERPGVSVLPPAPIELNILYEDPYLMAVDKPPNLAVHPTARYRSETLINILWRRYKRHEDSSRDIIPKLCHRLDRETSGVLLVAKDDWCRSKLGTIFETRKVEKEYLAIVEGEVKDRRGKIDLPLAPAQNSQVHLKMEVRHDEKGLLSVTEYEVQKRFEGYTLVLAKPKTGRQHQIRVHLASIGHPIVGDKIYGPDEALFLKSLESELSPKDLAILKLPRQALHAHRLSFEHPMEKKWMTIEAPLAPDLVEFLSGLKPRRS